MIWTSLLIFYLELPIHPESTSSLYFGKVLPSYRSPFLFEHTSERTDLTLPSITLESNFHYTDYYLSYLKGSPET